MYDAMFIAWQRPWNEEEAGRPTQVMLILAANVPGPSFRVGSVVRVNWLRTDASAFMFPVEAHDAAE
jgi:hypothetical protein